VTRRIKLSTLLASCCAIGVIALALASSNSKASPSTSSASGSALTVAVDTAAAGLDPYLDSSQDANNTEESVYDTLAKEGQTTTPSGLVVPTYSQAAIRPWLAQSWSLTNHDRTLTVHLRKGVMSHAGNELTAADLQYTWNRAWATNGEGTFDIQSVLHIPKPSWRVVNTFTWQVTLPQPNHLILDLLWDEKFGVVFDAVEAKKHATGADPWSTTWLSTHEAGFGPYEVESYQPGNEVVLRRFAKYWGSKPYFTTVVLKEVPDAANRLALVASGAVDVAENLPPNLEASVKGNPAVHTWSYAGDVVDTLMFNVATAPYNNPKFRQALSYATPSTQIRKAVFFGEGSPLYSPAPSTVPDYAPGYWHYTYNPRKAKSLLSAVGLPKGFTMAINYDSGDPAQTGLATQLQTAYEAVGIGVKLVGEPPATYQDRLNKSQFGVWVNTYFPIVPDVGYFFSWAFECKSVINSSHYCNNAFDAAITAGVRSSNAAQIKADYMAAQRIYVDDAAAVMLAEPGWQLLTVPTIRGVSFNPALGPYWAQFQRK
jgi:peptide/nickel transport system substrate-binding protein